MVAAVVAHVGLDILETSDHATGGTLTLATGHLDAGVPRLSWVSESSIIKSSAQEFGAWNASLQKLPEKGHKRLLRPLDHHPLTSRRYNKTL